MKRIFFIIAMTILWVACEDSIESPISGNLNTNALVPYKLDNHWVYEFDGYESLEDYDGQIVLSVDSVFTYTHQDSEIEMYKILYDPGLGPGIGRLSWDEFYYEGALNRTLYWKIEPDNPELCFRYPVPTGDQWVNEYSFFNYFTNIDKYTLNSKFARIRVPAGTFHCYDYQIDRAYTNNGGVDTSYTMNYYFKPGVGLIALKETWVDPDNPEKFIETWKWRLISYSLK